MSNLSLADQVKISAITVVLGITTVGIINGLSLLIRSRKVSFLTRNPGQGGAGGQHSKSLDTNRSFAGRDLDAASFSGKEGGGGAGGRTKSKDGRHRTLSQSSFPSFLSPGFGARHQLAAGEKIDPLSLLEEENEDDAKDAEEEDDVDDNATTVEKVRTTLQLNPKELAIGESKLDDATINLHLSRLLEHLKQRTSYHLGYPYNLQFKSDGLVPFLQFSINNLGDPFKYSNYGVHSREFELAVLEFFGSMWDIGQGQYWGYITTCGTEGNLLGVLYGREKFAPKRDAVLYCSKETHYSVPKAAALYRMDLELIQTDETGEMIYSDLEAKLKLHLDRPAVISINAGTTVKGAYDTVDSVVEVLNKLNIKRENYYIHVDGALNGMILPFLSKQCEPKRITFDKPIDSVSVSGHKMLGCPMPCGVVITRIEHMQRWASDVEYLNSTDTTIMGSRNGQAALAMWVALQRKGLDGIRADVVQCIDNSLYLKELFDKDGVKCMLNEFSTTVVFERPPEDVVQKWQLACTGDIAHVVVMPSVSKGKLRRFHRDVILAREEKRKAAAAGNA